MKIVYWANCKNTPHPTQDQEILKALKTVADVKFFDIKDFDMGKLVASANSADLFLFHGQIPTADEITAMLMVERIEVVLKNIHTKKVLWFMEKVWLSKGMIIEKLLPCVDHAFFSDETWVRRMKENVLSLHPAAPMKFLKGKYKEELACDIAIVGTMYGTRPKEYEFFKETFGEGVKFFDNKFGQDLADVCASAKIMFIPMFPFDDFFWSDRIYTYLSMGALVVQKRTHGLKEEGFIDGKHYFEYEKEQDLMALITSLLENPKLRKHIAKQGREFAKDHTYSERIKELISKLNINETPSI